MFLPVSLPVYNAPDALWKTLWVGPRTSDLLLSAKQWKISLQPCSQSQPHNGRHAFFFDAHRAHVAAALWHFDRVNLIDCPWFDYECGGNGSYFLISSQITESSLIGKHQKAKRQESLKVNITSSLNPFQRNWDFPYFPVFCHWRGNRGRLQFSCWCISHAGKEKTNESGQVFLFFFLKSLGRLSNYNYCTYVYNLKDSLYNHLHSVCALPQFPTS